MIALNDDYEFYETKTYKDISIEQCLYLMKPYLQDLINKHKDSKHKIRTVMFIFYDRPECNQIMYAYEVETNTEEINLNDDADNVITNLFNFLMDD